MSRGASLSERSPLWLMLGALAGSVAIGWLASTRPLWVLIGVAGLIGAVGFTQLKSAWLMLFTIGIHFDDLFVPLGFAKVGYGDFALGILLAYWLLIRFQRSTMTQIPDAWPLVVTYTVGVGISWLLGPAPELITGLFVRNTLYVVGYFALVDLMNSEREISLFLRGILISVIAHSLVAVIFMSPNARVDGLVGQPNIFGGLIGPGAIIALIFASRQDLQGWLRLALLVSGAFITFVLILTVSRGAQLAFFCAIFWVYRSRWRSIALAALVGVIVFQLIMVFDPDRLSYLFERWALEDGSVSTRQGIIWNALKVIAEYPMFGVGFAQFTHLEEVMRLDIGHGRASHNHYLGELATIGIPSALAIFAFVAFQGKLLWRVTAAAQRLASKRPEWSRAYLYLVILQGLFIFQSVTLVFRGGRRMIEWGFLALYTATALVYQKRIALDQEKE